MVYNLIMGTIDKALAKRRKQNAIQQENITHRAIFEPEVSKAPSEESKPRKRVKNGIRNKTSR
jgi:hypothetical protein